MRIPRAAALWLLLAASGAAAQPGVQYKRWNDVSGSALSYLDTDPDYYTIVMGIQRMTSEENPQWHLIMAAVVMAALPPVLVILFMQRLFVKGLTETEK